LRAPHARRTCIESGGEIADRSTGDKINFAAPFTVPRRVSGCASRGGDRAPGGARSRRRNRI